MNKVAFSVALWMCPLIAGLGVVSLAGNPEEKRRMSKSSDEDKPTLKLGWCLDAPEA